MGISQERDRGKQVKESSLTKSVNVRINTTLFSRGTESISTSGNVAPQ